MAVEKKQMFSVQLKRKQITKVAWLQEKTGIKNRSELIRQLIDNATVKPPVIEVELEEKHEQKGEDDETD